MEFRIVEQIHGERSEPVIFFLPNQLLLMILIFCQLIANSHVGAEKEPFWRPYLTISIDQVKRHLSVYTSVKWEMKKIWAGQRFCSSYLLGWCFVAVRFFGIWSYRPLCHHLPCLWFFISHHIMMYHDSSYNNSVRIPLLSSSQRHRLNPKTNYWIK